MIQIVSRPRQGIPENTDQILFQFWVKQKLPPTSVFNQDQVVGWPGFMVSFPPAVQRGRDQPGLGRPDCQISPLHTRPILCLLSILIRQKSFILTGAGSRASCTAANLISLPCIPCCRRVGAGDGLGGAGRGGRRGLMDAAPRLPCRISLRATHKAINC